MKAGERILHYELVRELGRGGMGAVWLARDTRLEREVALKFLLGLSGLDDEAGERLVREARSAAAIDHPGIVAVHSIESHAGGPFVVMEYVRGERLDRWVEEQGRPPAEILRLGLEAAEAVADAHARGIVHRDLKPSNLYVDERGHLRVLDFGLATIRDGPQLTRTGSTVGTLGYIAPEQLRGERVGPAADVFALCVVLHELFEGAKLFDRGQGAPGVIHDVLELQPTRLADSVASLPPGVEDVVARGLAKSTDERFADARELADALRSIDSDPTSSRVLELEREVGSVRRRSVVVGAAVLLLGLLLGFLIYGGDEDPPVAPAESATWEPRPLGLFAPGQRDPHLAPGGERLAYVAPVRGVPQLHVTDLEDPSPIVLTAEPRAVSRPRWAPDGQSILYSVDGPDDQPQAQSVHVVPLIGGAARRLFGPAAHPAWHPSGEWIAYEWNGVLRRFDLESGEASTVEGFPTIVGAEFGRLVAFSPDGERLVHRRSELGPLGSLWEFDLTTSSDRVLIAERSRLSDPVYTTDGRSVLFTSDFDGGLTLYAVDRESGAIERVTEGLGSDLSPSVDASGERIAYLNVREEYRLVLYDPELDEPRELLSSRNPILGPRFAPDGRRIAFFGGPDADLYLTSTDGGTPSRPFETTEALELFPTFTPDGGSLLFYSEDVDGPSLVRRPIQGGEPETVFEGWSMQRRSFADLSPDGRRLVVFDVDALRTVVHDLERGTRDVLDAWIFRARWSPDGRSLVGVNNELRIVVLDVETGEVTLHERGEVPTFGPDGRIYFMRNESERRELFVLDPATGDSRRLASLGPSWDVNADLLDVDPTGRVVWSEFEETGSEIRIAERR